MSAASLARFLIPWKYRRDHQARRIAALRERDGDACRRCRRTIRFDLPAGHDLGARIEPIAAPGTNAAPALADLCLTHGRCNVSGRDHTELVMERLRPQREADLFVKARTKRKAA
jgi:hypothetical protein